MEGKDKEYIKLRFGLTLRKIINEHKTRAIENRKKGIRDRNLINSFGRLEIASGIPKATLVDIVQGRKNAASTTIAAILDAFEMKLSTFGDYYDAITDSELTAYRIELDKAKENRKNKKKKNRV